MDTAGTATGEVPEDPRVDGAEGERRDALDAAVREQPMELGRGEVRVEDEPGSGAHERFVARRAQLVALVRGAPVLPYQRAMQRAASRAIPDHGCLALVRDPDRRDRFAVEHGDDLGEGAGRCTPDVVGVVLDPAGSREVLGELAVRIRARAPVLVDGHGAHAGRARVDRQHDRHYAGCDACSIRATA